MSTKMPKWAAQAETYLLDTHPVHGGQEAIATASPSVIIERGYDYGTLLFDPNQPYQVMRVNNSGTRYTRTADGAVAVQGQISLNGQYGNVWCSIYQTAIQSVDFPADAVTLDGRLYRLCKITTKAVWYSYRVLPNPGITENGQITVTLYLPIAPTPQDMRGLLSVSTKPIGPKTGTPAESGLIIPPAPLVSGLTTMTEPIT